MCRPWSPAQTARLRRTRAGAPRRLFDRDPPQQHAKALLLAQLAAWQLGAMLAAVAAPAEEGASAAGVCAASPAGGAAAGEGWAAGVAHGVPAARASAAGSASDAGVPHHGGGIAPEHAPAASVPHASGTRTAPGAVAGGAPVAGMPHDSGGPARPEEAEPPDLVAAFAAWASRVAEVR